MILHGDSLHILKTLEPNSVDAVVTDPPYGLKFMGKKWDYDVPSVELWREVLRVLKPGGHVLSFGGTRTYHRMVVAIEDAGYEIRDQVMWIYGAGFPKSLNVGKAIAKMRGEELKFISSGRSGTTSRAYQSEEQTTAGAYEITEASNEWQGWGTALKPANEPICLARKPLEKSLTVAENVLKYGTGALNVDACRIAGKLEGDPNRFAKTDCGSFNKFSHSAPVVRAEGRWPANVLFDEEAASVLDEMSGILKSGAMSGVYKNTLMRGKPGERDGKAIHLKQEASSGGASRFFYVAKASKRERNAGLEGMPEKLSGMSNGAQSHGEHYDKGQGIGLNRVTAKQNHHPTVKPVKLMEYLIKLITPPNGVVLDPFCGSGSTGVAAKRLGFEFIGIELSEEYVEIAKRRVAHG